jgi:putative FmdB family regulatory protein
MPTYGYQCGNCENTFEVFQRMTDDPLTTCEQCGGTLRKKIFPVGIAFKGSGFYVNDYAKSSAAKPEAAESKDSSATTPAETKPADSAAPVASSEAKPAAAPAAASTPAPAPASTAS